MTPAIPCSTSNVSSIPGASFIRRKNNCSTGCYILQKYTKKAYAQETVFPLSVSVKYFSDRRTCGLNYPRSHITSVTGIDVAMVEEANPSVTDEDSGGALENSSTETSRILFTKEVSAPTRGQSKRSRPGRKSDFPPVKNEELVPGASFTGKVKSVQPFGAFVDFGAFTDGLVHVSQLSDTFVKDVGAVVTVGQEVTVRLVEANTETSRISLTMRSGNDASKSEESPDDNDRTRSPRRNAQNSSQRRDEGRKPSKFVKGQDLEGKVKNLARAGSFISLPDGEEGFLPTEEEADDGLGSLMGASILQVDQEVSVRVLRISRGRVTLTMKKEENVAALDSKLNPGTVHSASNPFLLAFRKNKDISAFLDGRDKEGNSNQETEALVPAASTTDEAVEENKNTKDEVDVVADATTETSDADTDEHKESQSIASDTLQTVDPAAESIASDTLETVDPAAESIASATLETADVL